MSLSVHDLNWLDRKQREHDEERSGENIYYDDEYEDEDEN